MARDKKKKKNINIPEGIVDYYAIYSIDRNLGTKEIKKLLLQRQGEIRSQMAGGALNAPEILEKLQEAYNEIANVVKVFKNEERRKEYDILLDAAYEAGKIDVEAQTMAQDLYEEIEAMFLKGNYRGAVKKCLEALNNNVKDYRIYILLAKSYFALNDPDKSISTIDDGLSVHPNNMPLLRAGARFSNEGKKDYNKAQSYVNRILEIDADSAIAASEQSYLYMSTGKQDLAYKMIDDYIEKHPSDMEFRKDCAYDMIGYSYSCYTKDPESGAYVIASEEDYQKCLDTCNKAMSIYNDENVQDALDNAKAFGTIEFNDENNESIKWSFIGGAVFWITAIFSAPQILSGGGDFGTIVSNIIGLLLIFAFGGILIYCGVKLKKVSYRPYWQINKFILTGQREKEEARYILIGNILGGLIKWSFKASWAIIKFMFKLIIHFV